MRRPVDVQSHFAKRITKKAYERLPLRGDYFAISTAFQIVRVSSEATVKLGKPATQAEMLGSHRNRLSVCLGNNCRGQPGGPWRHPPCCHHHGIGFRLTVPLRSAPESC